MSEEINIPFAESIQTGSQPPESPLHDNEENNNTNGGDATEETQTINIPPIINSQSNNITNNVIDQISGKTGRKYNIIDLYWTINTNIWPINSSQSRKLNANEADLAVISYNITFNNLRLVYYRLNSNSFQNNVLFLSNCTRLIDGAIYPIYLYLILHQPILRNLPCFEQIITQTGEDWQSQRPTIIINKNADEKIIEIKIGKYFYPFARYQFDLFLDVCQFILKEGRTLHGYLNIVR